VIPDLRVLVPFGKSALLNVRELAGLWHLPRAADDVPFVERTTARRHLPLPATVGFQSSGEGCRIGTSEHQGHSVQVVLPLGLLQRHLLAIAKTRRGKSSLMLQFAHHLMLAGTTGPGGRAAGPEKRCLILVDPHSDLAASALGLVPQERRGDVVYLDLANSQRPFGVNLLDVGLGWNRDQAVGNALRVFKREFDAFWGPRMEDAFRFALMALFEANEAICHMDTVLAEQLACESAERYGRPALHVELDLEAAADRVRGGTREKESEDHGGSKGGAGGQKSAGGVATGGEVPRPGRPRNRQKRTAGSGRQTRSDTRRDEAQGGEDSEAPAA
jgi:hypothetical protein